MKLSFIATTLAALATTAAAQNGHYDSLDTTQGPKLFDPPRARRGGYTYADEWSVAVNAEMDTQGMAFKGSFQAVADTSMTVTDLEGGNTRVNLTLQNVKGGIDSFIMTIHCDSNDRTHSDPDCEEVFQVVGAEESFVMDKQGNILEITDPYGNTFDLTDLDDDTFAGLEAGEQQVQQPTVPQPETLASKFQANKFAASQHFDNSQQLLKLIPDHAVRPGDSWIDDVDMQGMGTFKGDSVLKGYTTYEGAECAVFEFRGILHLDISQLAMAIGVDDTTQLPSNMADANITNLIIWDYKDDISRWSQVNITTSFDIPNPMNPEDPNTVHVPVEVIFSINTDITARPDNEDALYGGASESYYAPAGYQAPEEKSGESKKSGGGGGWGMFFLFVLFAGMGAAGYVIYKRREGQDFFVRRSYDFAPVGNEPIFNANPMV